MKLKETKRVLICLVILSAFFLLPKSGNTTDYSSSNFTVKDPVVDGGSSSSSSANFGLGQSINQSAIGISTSTNFQLWSGFQYYFKVNANVLTATPGNAQASLSWTVPSTFLGATISSYEVGVGTTSGSYVFTDRGNVTNYTQTGLSNGTQYFFIIKAKTAGGFFLVFSNEASATPTAPVTPPPPPPGGGGGGYTPPPSGNAILIIKGLAYPSSQVTVLRDGQIVAVTTADPGAGFNIQLSNLGVATYNFGVYSTDKDGLKSPTFSFAETFSSGVTIVVDNIFLGPSIGLTHSIIKKGETITAYGYSAPSAEVKVFFNSPEEFIETTTTASSGAWTKPFNTSVLELGSHTSKSQAGNGSLLSDYSQTIGFAVGNNSVETPVGSCKRSDLNCDGRVNLTDFSILLYFWQKTAPSNPRADINSSGLVDLTDFSILLYDWTG
ncbi:MAG: fibronectin type III domain-containing protein [Candidatus Doudnabacteria bacterium]|nr:fibronectin type III domain-containing protein [Candidatus Doudnabacteria bacterium]